MREPDNDLADVFMGYIRADEDTKRKVREVLGLSRVIPIGQRRARNAFHDPDGQDTDHNTKTAENARRPSRKGKDDPIEERIKKWHQF